nr:murein biosynthesis integral membrane protein MurJ [Roseibium sp. CAU 1639]
MFGAGRLPQRFPLLMNVANVAGLTLASRALGLLRDIILAATLGAGPVATAFMLAFRLANQFRALLAEGAFTAAFLPIDAIDETDAKETRSFRAEVLGWLVLANLVLLAAVLIAPEVMLGLFAPGLDASNPAYPLASLFLRITFPFLFFASLLAFFGARLGANGRFTAFAATPIVMNVCLIGGLQFSWMFASSGHAAAWSVLVSGGLQLALVIWAFRRADLKQPWPKLGLSTSTRTFFRNLGPALLSSGALQVAAFTDTVLASFLPTGSLVHLYFADRLYQLPIGVLSLALGTVMLPDIARHFSKGETLNARRVVNHALWLCLALGLPAAGILAFWGEPIARLLFQRGSFTSADTIATASILTAYAFGLLPALMVRPLVVAFQGRGDTATPFRLLAIALGLNIVCKVALVPNWGAPGLALATSVGMTCYFVLLFWSAWRRGYCGTTRQPIH